MDESVYQQPGATLNRRSEMNADNGYNARISRLEASNKLQTELIHSLTKAQNGLAERAAEIESRTAQWVDYLRKEIEELKRPSIGSGLNALNLQQQAAQQQATEHLYAPLRNDTKAVLDLAAFARRLLQYDDLGQQCSAAVRDAAREALGMKKVES